jgi:CRISPR-associated protein Csm3
MIELRNRYLFEGHLAMQTALHIGGGRVTLSNSDSPVVLTPEEKPYIPGSSFKGALRSTIEKLVPYLPDSAKLRSCGLLELSEDTIIAMKKEDLEKVCPTVRQRNIQNRLRNATPQQQEEVTKEIYRSLCETCRLFGSPYAAARINVNDFYLAKDDKGEDEWSGIVQVRDGVAIDRDSETAKDRLKYDFEVVPSNAVFSLSITLENATREDLQLVSVGLSEFVHGFGMIGGKRSRGLGACHLVDLKVSSLELGDGVKEAERNERLKNYLLKRTFSNENEPGDTFLQRHIETLFA